MKTHTLIYNHIYIFFNIFFIVCHSVQHTQMSCVVPYGSASPFGQQSMQDVFDRLHLHTDPNKFITRDVVLVEGVSATDTHWTSDKSHKQYMDNKLFAVADRCGPVSLMRHITFDRKFKRNSAVVYNPRGGKIFGSRERLCDFMAMVCGGTKPLLTSLFKPCMTGFY